MARVGGIGRQGEGCAVKLLPLTSVPRLMVPTLNWLESYRMARSKLLMPLMPAASVTVKLTGTVTEVPAVIVRFRGMKISGSGPVGGGLLTPVGRAGMLGTGACPE